VAREEKRMVSAVYREQWDSAEVEVEEEHEARREICREV
jgi:hypothetical protein